MNLFLPDTIYFCSVASKIMSCLNNFLENFSDSINLTLLMIRTTTNNYKKVENMSETMITTTRRWRI